MKRANLAGLYSVQFQKISCMEAAQRLGATCSTASLSCEARGFLSSPLWTSQSSLSPLSLLCPPCTAVGSLALSSKCPACSKGKAALRCCQSLPFSLLKEPCPSTFFWGADIPTPGLGILVALCWVTPVSQYLLVPPHGLLSPQGRILHLSWQNFSQFPSACSSSLSRSCCKTAPPLSILTDPRSLVLSAHLSRVHSTSSRSLIQVLNRTGASYCPPCPPKHRDYGFIVFSSMTHLFRINLRWSYLDKNMGM